MGSGGMMSTFVLVHGSWGGGWEWRGVASELRRSGHEVHAPTLSGLGERAHLSGVGVGLTTHIEDVASLLWFEDLEDVVLVGWSYGAAVCEGVADLTPQRLRLVVNLDGPLIQDGQAVVDSWDADDPDRARLKDTHVPPPSEEDMGLALADADLCHWAAARLRPQPTRCWTEPLPARGGRRNTVAHAYLACTEQQDDESASQVAALRSDPAWEVHDVPLNHLGLVYDPRRIAAALHKIAP
ncbi:alpha/beta fold hydrolase [Kribbella sp. NPDC049174]|uniref:alpha/beta fold hydrolase n=1 Tax=Kribbella sp. NPDC049174 TaxID=3364112 RepID=UPI00371620D4